MNITCTADILNLSDDELASLGALITSEKNARKAQREKLAWEKIVNAIREYCQDFGEIRIFSDIYLDGSEDFKDSGYIEYGDGDESE